MEWLLLLLIAGFAAKKKAPTATTLTRPSGSAWLVNPASYPSVAPAPSVAPSGVSSDGTMVPAPDLSATNAAIADALQDLNNRYIAFLQENGFEPKSTPDPGNVYGFSAFITATATTADFVLWAQTFRPSVWDAANEAWRDFQRALVDGRKLQDFAMAIEMVSSAGLAVETKLNSLTALQADFATIHSGNVDMDAWANVTLPSLIDQVHLRSDDTWESTWPSRMINSGELFGAVGRMYQAIREAEQIVLGVGPAPSSEIGIGEAAGIMALYHRLYHLALELPDQDTTGLSEFATQSEALANRVNAAINAINAVAFKRFIASEAVYKLANPLAGTWQGGGSHHNWKWFGITIDGVLYHAPSGPYPQADAVAYSVPYWPGDRPVMYPGITWIGEWNDQVFLGNTFGGQTAYDTMKAHYVNYFDLVYNPARGF